MVSIVRKLINKCKQTCLDSYHRLLNLPEAPRQVAQGIALGVAFDFLPVPFISIPLSFLVAKLVRVHAVAATLTVCLFKPVVPLFFTLNIFVGKLLVGSAPSPISEEIAHGVPLLTKALLQIKALGLPFLVGSVTNAVWAGLLVYYAAVKFLEARQKAIKKNPESRCCE
ncbi:DUF2062 domain-containing protein [Desulforamulus hydrothermalis]|uniref:DUF2062 domain-containing protein n=1 Tax=Desulforamulus hydrothermalis Lam5 = DSM 18033 TaxID=1121428 RepID=K8EII6_9FIRM|nr:DUF2062 domain-containing protein [Desulforamulus hydrothermalis]CCO08411.1 conserved membrane hypothetical protein [Desulforamulus hydrothermalis Lam5 = DSM 18033]SHH14844.1 hypothetical protein SAMN02745177_01626 [Desulforamulus hydrothermalis Lam5 = DSM 18033]